MAADSRKEGIEASRGGGGAALLEPTGEIAVPLERGGTLETLNWDFSANLLVTVQQGNNVGTCSFYWGSSYTYTRAGGAVGGSFY
jgi:hypothetical protein